MYLLYCYVADMVKALADGLMLWWNFRLADIGQARPSTLHIDRLAPRTRPLTGNASGSAPPRNGPVPVVSLSLGFSGGVLAVRAQKPLQGARCGAQGPGL